MDSTLSVDELIEAASHLPAEDRRRLLRALAELTAEPKHEVTELRGLGKEVWQNQDGQQYVDAERDSWES
jgi:hypothetical protein